MLVDKLTDGDDELFQVAKHSAASACKSLINICLTSINVQCV